MDGKNELNILVVDDHALTRAMVQSILKSDGFVKIAFADGGRGAIQKLEEKFFDLIVCDWNMPDMNGIEVLKFVRSKPEWEKLPFIMLTAEVYSSNVKEAVEAGVSDYVAKPFTPDVLLNKVNKVLGDQHG